jgi:hypothetical protein
MFLPLNCECENWRRCWHGHLYLQEHYTSCRSNELKKMLTWSPALTRTLHFLQKQRIEEDAHMVTCTYKHTTLPAEATKWRRHWHGHLHLQAHYTSNRRNELKKTLTWPPALTSTLHFLQKQRTEKDTDMATCTYKHSTHPAEATNWKRHWHGHLHIQANYTSCRSNELKNTLKWPPAHTSTLPAEATNWRRHWNGHLHIQAHYTSCRSNARSEHN